MTGDTQAWTCNVMVLMHVSHLQLRFRGGSTNVLVKEEGKHIYKCDSEICS